MSRATQVRAAAGFVIVIWVTYLVDRVAPLEQLGLRPREFSGLTGIVAMPFLHSSFAHLTANTIPLLVLLGLLLVTHQRLVVTVPVLVVSSGTVLWVFGRDGLHIGASALVFGLAACLIAGAWRSRSVVALLVALVVAAFYGGSLLTGIVPTGGGVSWDGHLAGVVTGVATGIAGVGQARSSQARL